MNDNRLPPHFWLKVRQIGDCWIWVAGCFGNGYPAFCVDGKNQPAHRVSYEALIGPIPRGLVLDHLCRNPRCVNPSHLEPVTHRENLLRGEGFSAQFSRRKACPQGHEYTPENTRLYRGSRHCRQCAKDKTKRRSEQGYFRDLYSKRKKSKKG